jgi:alkylation response protein AidB-like acyl-CoA dehydrogenase
MFGVMMSYKAPLDDMNFLLHDVFQIQSELNHIDAFKEFDRSLYSAILDESAKFSEQILFPMNRSGDEEGCTFKEGHVSTPKGFKKAYHHYINAGWQGLSADPQYGGQGLPKMLHVLVEEMTYSANTSFSLYPSLTSGAYHAIHAHANETLKSLYLPPMLEGRWSGAMGLTEPHAGSDLGMIKTKATPHEDAYLIDGTKIFITGGEHDLTENIIHLVLAKRPNAPEGAKGISLFLVPKRHVHSDGTLGDSNGVTCGSIEKKMGIKASSTCLMNFDSAKGYLVGEPNKGLFAMFTMMNLERLSIGLQGIGLAETSYQLSRAYALDRKQGKNNQNISTHIIHHSDIRRMLLEQRAYTEPARALAVYMGLQIDRQYHSPDPQLKKQAEKRMAFLTPIAKAFFTDKGFDACNHGVQILGGHGFIREWGLEQLIRDAKIAQIYEGTNGIQAQDFMVRKICLDKNDLLSEIFSEMDLFFNKSHTLPLYNNLRQQCLALKSELAETIIWLKTHFNTRSSELQGGATQLLHAFGHLIYGWMWLMMLNQSKKLTHVLCERKKVAAHFFLHHLLPQAFELSKRVRIGYETYYTQDDVMI